MRRERPQPRWLEDCTHPEGSRPLPKPTMLVMKSFDHSGTGGGVGTHQTRVVPPRARQVVKAGKPLEGTFQNTSKVCSRPGGSHDELGTFIKRCAIAGHRTKATTSRPHLPCPRPAQGLGPAPRPTHARRAPDTSLLLCYLIHPHTCQCPLGQAPAPATACSSALSSRLSHPVWLSPGAPS